MDFDPEIAFLVLPGSALEQAAEAAGGKAVRLFLADRGYLSNGQLAPRGQPGAVIHDPEQVLARVLRVIRDKETDTVDGQPIAMPVQSILIHSDTAGAVELARLLRAGMTRAGVEITPLSRHI